MPLDTTSFEQELRNLINSHSMENASNTPDWILARFLLSCLEAFNTAVQETKALEPSVQSDGPAPIDSAESPR